MVITYLLLIALCTAPCLSWAPTQCGKGNIITQWGKMVNPDSVLPEYPRPQMERPSDTWQNLNGLWEFEPATATSPPPFGQTLSDNILVPFPVESCLSGIGQNYQYLWYRLVFNQPSGFSSGRTLIHFGSVDWQCSVWVNQKLIGNHTGGYDRFTMDITSALTATNNELLVYVYDPSDLGYQPNGKQRISAINQPGGDTYTPASGIWQTVWLENVPENYIYNLRMNADTTALTITTFTYPDNSGPMHGVDMPGGDMGGMPVSLETYSHWDCYALCQKTSGCVGWSFAIPLCGGDSGNRNPSCWLKSTLTTAVQDDCRIAGTMQASTSSVTYAVMSGNSVVATATGTPGASTTINIPSPQLWSPSKPFLYTLKVSTDTDTVMSYFGMRTSTLGTYQHSATPDTGPQVGVDRPGGDMPGSPFNLPNADPNLCYSACKTTGGCVNWAYAVPNCDGYSQPTCWLKSSYQGTTSNQCRVSGSMGQPAYEARRPNLNGEYLYYAGWLDQSFWPDGIYTAPTDAALAFDLQSVLQFGLNAVRLHQKVNSERWYWYADSLGIIILQDMYQKYGGATAATIEPFVVEFYRMVDYEYNHPSIVQWEVFNEGDCVGVFNASQVVQMALDLDPSRLVDTNSGGPANGLYIANVNDVHTYPYPGDPKPSATQYAMIGEFGGIGAFVDGHEWVPGGCGTYLPVNTPAEEAGTYVNMTLQINTEDVSVSIYTQITDVEEECDGFLNYDRTNKFTAAEVQSIYTANQNLIKSSSLKRK